MITMDKEYRTRDGEAVRVLCVDKLGTEYPVITLVLSRNGEEVLEEHTYCGRFYTTGTESPRDLIEVTKYDDFKIDDLVTVWDTNRANMVLGYFAGRTPDGMATIWSHGSTAITTNGCSIPYKQCIKVGS